jgi:hypothetical protein
MLAMKSRGLFPGPKSRPKRSFASAAGNSEYKHNLPNEDGFQEGMTGWKAGRSAGGVSGNNRQTNRPMFHDKAQSGEGGCAWDASAEKAMRDAGKPDQGHP